MIRNMGSAPAKMAIRIDNRKESRILEVGKKWVVPIRPWPVYSKAR